MRRFQLTLAFVPVLLVAGCDAEVPRRPAVPPAAAEAQCGAVAAQQSPLVADLPAPERANLEARLREGGVVVAYSGCSLRVLTACRVGGVYGWRRTTTATDTVEVHDPAELHAKLPLGAASLEGELARTGRLAVQTTVSGQLALMGIPQGQGAPVGACAGATHVVGALTLGAFKLQSGGARGPETLVRNAGDPEACQRSTDAAPDAQCGSPIQLFLQALPGAQPAAGPPGTVQVRFRSADVDRRWQVLSFETPLCTTPCDRWVEPSTALTMRSESGFLTKNSLNVPDLPPVAAGSAPLLVRAHPASFNLYGFGVTLTTLGVLGAAAGVALAAVGCDTQRDTMCVGGAITIPASLAVVVPGIYLILRSAARAEVLGPGVEETEGASLGPFRDVMAGPGFVTGKF
jgi:hypothetical protein